MSEGSKSRREHAGNCESRDQRAGNYESRDQRAGNCESRGECAGEHESSTEQLLTYLYTLQTPQLSQSAVQSSLLFIEDTLGVAIAGHQGVFTHGLLASVDEYADFASEHTATALKGEVIGSKTRYPLAIAAMLNAYLIHCQEYDCVHERAVVHPMAVILGSLLSVARARTWSGSMLILGVVSAVETAAILGCASRASMRFFRPAMCGALAASAALAKLSGANAAQIGNTMAIAAGQLGGTMQAHREGVSLLPMQIGFAARAAVSAWQMAEQGLQGPKDFLLGECGYFALHEGAHAFEFELAQRLKAAQGGQFAISEVAHKPFPSGRATHGGLQALLELLADLPRQIEIQAVLLQAPPLIWQLIARPMRADQSSPYHRLCFAYCVAVVLQKWRAGAELGLSLLGVKDFSPAMFNDPELLALAGSVQVEKDQNPNSNALSPVRLQLRYRHLGITEQRMIDVHAVLGSPDNPLSKAQHLQKLRGNLALNWPSEIDARLKQLQCAVQELPGAASVDALLSALRN